MSGVKKRLIISLLSVCLISSTTLWYFNSREVYSQAVQSIAHAPTTKLTPTPAPTSSTTEPQQPSAEILSHRLNEYHINVKLDETTGTLIGSQTVTFKHPGKKTINELYFHLYPNAFSSKDTTFMKESGGKLRGDVMPKNGYGNMTLTEVTTTDGISLLHRVMYVQPDDGNTNDRTLAKIRLPVSIRGGESITLKIGFTVKLPQIFARMGIVDNFVMAGQWFPKLSVYEPVGRRGATVEGWNLHQYHGNSEFYSDFGIYNVKIDVPKNYIIAATGFPTKATVIQNNRKIEQYYADDVHDFAWSASPNFVFMEEPYSSDEVPGVKIKLYLDPMHKDLKDRYFYAAKVALANFSKWYGSYPYSTLSIVVPPKSGNGAGGMEYPTLITAFGASEEAPGYELERTVIHEIGHQFFYGMIANNEFEEAWLDEAFTSYAEDKLMDQEFGIKANLPIQGSLIHQPVALTEPSWKYGSSSNYANNVYYRGKLVLLDIERRVGTSTMNRIMNKYALQNRFKHPTTKSFQKVVEQVSGQSWNDYFNEHVYNNVMIDYAVNGITVKPVSINGTAMYESTVQLQRNGAVYPNVPLLLKFTDGHTIRKTWSSDDTQLQIKFNYAAPLDWVMIDPEYKMILENKHNNNFLRAQVDPKLTTRLDLGIFKAIETIVGVFLW